MINLSFLISFPKYNGLDDDSLTMLITKIKSILKVLLVRADIELVPLLTIMSGQFILKTVLHISI